MRPAVRVGVGAAIAAVLAALIASVAVGWARGAESGTAEIVSPVDAEQAPAQIYVHVSGAVRSPGLYRLAAASRVMDAVAAAGGLTPEADDAAVNLARPLSDGEQLHLPAQGESAAESIADGRVNINTADAVALQVLPGIGPALAARIVSWRDENGRFASADDLLAVSGIGDRVLAGLRDLVTL